MSFGSDADRIENLESIVEGLVKVQGKLIELIGRQNDAFFKVGIAQQKVNQLAAEFIINNTAGSEVDRKALLDILAEVKKELASSETMLLLKNLLPPLPPAADQ